MMWHVGGKYSTVYLLTSCNALYVGRFFVALNVSIVIAASRCSGRRRAARAAARYAKKSLTSPVKEPYVTLKCDLHSQKRRKGE